MNKIYCTTIGKYWVHLGGFDASDPKPPDLNYNWRLVGSTAADGNLFWFWERDLTENE